MLLAYYIHQYFSNLLIVDYNFVKGSLKVIYCIGVSEY